ncbi:putative carbonic anhydrase 3 [Culicoides brevitarsis]|uniref:putative carbonic anhydrase 3 n=1 Tax=Culicoides brevitarsis TaxID=469753 RepID=UPI00307BDFFA
MCLKLNLLSLIVISVLLLHVCHSQDFGYDGDHGPSHWGEEFGECTGKHQSPINIDSEHVTRKVLPKLKLANFHDKPKEMSITNNGHTVQLTVNVENMPSVKGGPLNGTYHFAQLHFHWGDNDTYGSEDTIEGHSYPMELHAVFFKSDYLSVKSALNHEDGLTVLAFFFEISEEDNPHYEEFTTLLGEIIEPRTSAVFKKLPSFGELFATDFTHYYTYNGSLTTPPCSEVVTWIDFANPILLSHNQLETFRHLKDDHHMPLTHNFRPVQPLGDREIWFNILPEEEGKDIDLSKPHTHPHDEEEEHELDENRVGMRPAYRKEAEESENNHHNHHKHKHGKGESSRIGTMNLLPFVILSALTFV